MTAPLPSPREAMCQAVERAQLGEFDGARLWLDIARELRLGAAGSQARPMPRPLDDRGRLTAEADLATAGLAPIGPSLASAYAQVGVPAEAPPERTSETVVAGFALPVCAYCGGSLVWVTPGPEAGSPVPHWAHALTEQTVCPIPVDGQSRTFATPLGDG